MVMHMQYIYSTAPWEMQYEYILHKLQKKSSEIDV